MEVLQPELTFYL